MSNVVHGALLWGMMTLGASFIARVPMAALAGVTAWMGIRLLDWGSWKRLPKMRLVDSLAFLLTAAAVLILDAEWAVGIGCAIHFFRYLYLRFTGQLGTEGEPVQVETPAKEAVGAESGK